MDKLTKKGLDGTQLKTIALVLMVLDHIHYFFEFTGCIPTVFSMLGRLSAPLFLFCTVEGFAHTHDRKRHFIQPPLRDRRSDAQRAGVFPLHGRRGQNRYAGLCS